MKGHNNIFPPHFRDFIEQLNKKEVEYLVIRGYAMGAYGHFRSTGYLDIFIHATKKNAERAIRACIDYGIPQSELNIDMFLIPRMIGIGEVPLRIEILKTLDVVDFKFAYQRVQKTVVDGLTINVVSLDDLIVIKAAAIKGRNEARDVEDYNFLQKLKNKIAKK